MCLTRTYTVLSLKIKHNVFSFLSCSIFNDQDARLSQAFLLYNIILKKSIVFFDFFIFFANLFFSWVIYIYFMVKLCIFNKQNAQEIHYKQRKKNRENKKDITIYNINEENCSFWKTRRVAKRSTKVGISNERGSSQKTSKGGTERNGRTVFFRVLFGHFVQKNNMYVFLFYFCVFKASRANFLHYMSFL